MQNEQLVAKLSDKRLRVRLKALKGLYSSSLDGEPTISRAENSNINYAFRTIYSCFDRSASMSVYYADKFGMPLTAIVDYASLSSADELIKAEKITGGIYYCGAEVTVLQNGSKVKFAALGIPHKSIKAFNDDLAPYRNKRQAYTNAIREKLNAKFKKYGFSLPHDFWSLFGAIKTTSVEDLYVNLADEIVKKYGEGQKTVEFLINELSFNLSEDENRKLSDSSNNLYTIDLAFTLYNNLKIKLPEENLFSVEHFISLCTKYGAISAAMYKSGNVDDFIASIKSLGVNCAVIDIDKHEQDKVSYFYNACQNYEILPLAVTIISHPRKIPETYFETDALAKKYNDNALCIVGHEIASSINPNDGMFTETTKKQFPTLEERIKLFSHIGSKGTV